MERRHTDAHEREFLHIHFKLSMTKTELKFIKTTHNLDTANEKIAFQELQLTESLKRITLLEEQNSNKDLQIASLITYLVPQLPTGRLEWKVEGVKQKIRNKEETYSDPFYVGLYKCQGSIQWDFSSLGELVVLIHIMKGDFDSELHWPIGYKYSIVLTNQINSKDNLVYHTEISKKWLEKFPDSFNRTTGIRNDGFACLLMSNTEILEEKYCKQDCITLHISVEVLPSL